MYNICKTTLLRGLLKIVFGGFNPQISLTTAALLGHGLATKGLSAFRLRLRLHFWLQTVLVSYKLDKNVFFSKEYCT